MPLEFTFASPTCGHPFPRRFCRRPRWHQVRDLEAKCAAALAAEAERRAADEAKHADDTERLKNVNSQLKANLQAMLSQPQRK